MVEKSEEVTAADAAGDEKWDCEIRVYNRGDKPISRVIVECTNSEWSHDIQAQTVAAGGLVGTLLVAYDKSTKKNKWSVVFYRDNQRYHASVSCSLDERDNFKSGSLIISSYNMTVSPPVSSICQTSIVKG
ncbi:hypothetical protein Stsp01_12710 [Streptomyces sp. NBRC 13847]|uniref:hypothetical protein n=1 Tax=Streptomyces TaxID=1883 RepID=UPI0024A46763|nr:hypothetical protein [Streptomyces sp. NBRC 13847]GLW14528.1 hypothetical protein Stsp01_12710 [Streptomyces sp. NBRC 13847]